MAHPPYCLTTNAFAAQTRPRPSGTSGALVLGFAPGQRQPTAAKARSRPVAHPPYYLTTNAFAACQARRSLAPTTTLQQYSIEGEVSVRRPVTKAGARPVAHPPYHLTTNAFAACKVQRGQTPEGSPRTRTWRDGGVGCYTHTTTSTTRRHTTQNTRGRGDKSKAHRLNLSGS